MGFVYRRGWAAVSALLVGHGLIDAVSFYTEGTPTNPRHRPLTLWIPPKWGGPHGRTILGVAMSPVVFDAWCADGYTRRAEDGSSGHQAARCRKDQTMRRATEVASTSVSSNPSAVTRTPANPAIRRDIQAADRMRAHLVFRPHRS
jgi:hypothetical protein